MSKCNMNEKEILLRIKRCLQKAGISSWYVSEDEDADSDMYFLNGKFYIKDVETEFTAENFFRITYRDFDEDDDSLCDEDYTEGEHNYVKLRFKDDNSEMQVIWIQYDLELNASLKDGYYYDQACDVLERLRVNAYTVDADMSTTNLTVREGIVTEYKGTDEVITIPEGVIGIAANVFHGNKKVKEVRLPQTVQKIYPFAFAGCSNLTEIKFLEGLLFIGRCAFSLCENLTYVEIPKSIEMIGQHAFLNSGIKDVSLKNESAFILDDHNNHIFAGTPYMMED